MKIVDSNIEPINTEKDGTCRTIKAQYQNTSAANLVRQGTFGATGVSNTEKTRYRIRKLTPKECFRLLGVKDEDSDKLSSRQSASSQYHLAGDSIVTSCLMAIFAQMLGMDAEPKIDELVASITAERRNK